GGTRPPRGRVAAGEPTWPRASRRGRGPRRAGPRTPLPGRRRSGRTSPALADDDDLAADRRELPHRRTVRPLLADPARPYAGVEVGRGAVHRRAEADHRALDGGEPDDVLDRNTVRTGDPLGPRGDPVGARRRVHRAGADRVR